jgi:hypothetical protein
MTKTKAEAEPDPTVTVRWIRDIQPPGANVNGRTYTGRGPIYKRRPLPGGGEATELIYEGDVQQLPADAARVLVEANYVEIR